MLGIDVVSAYKNEEIGSFATLRVLFAFSQRNIVVSASQRKRQFLWNGEATCELERLFAALANLALQAAFQTCQKKSDLQKSFGMALQALINACTDPLLTLHLYSFLQARRVLTITNEFNKHRRDSPHLPAENEAVSGPPMGGLTKGHSGPLEVGHLGKRSLTPQNARIKNMFP